MDLLKNPSSFDVRFAISALYLWLLFGYLMSNEYHVICSV